MIYYCVIVSRAIMAYLVNQYCKEDSNLYPKDAQKRAIVDRMLHFDIGTLYKSMVDYFVSFFPNLKLLLKSFKLFMTFQCKFLLYLRFFKRFTITVINKEAKIIIYCGRFKK